MTCVHQTEKHKYTITYNPIAKRTQANRRDPETSLMANEVKVSLCLQHTSRMLENHHGITAASFLRYRNTFRNLDHSEQNLATTIDKNNSLTGRTTNGGCEGVSKGQSEHTKNKSAGTERCHSLSQSTNPTLCLVKNNSTQPPRDSHTLSTKIHIPLKCFSTAPRVQSLN